MFHQGPVVGLNGGGLAVEQHGIVELAALDGDGGQTQIGVGMDTVIGHGLAVILFGFVQVAHEQITFAEFLVDFVIQLPTHDIPSIRGGPFCWIWALAVSRRLAATPQMVRVGFRRPDSATCQAKRV